MVTSISLNFYRYGFFPSRVLKKYHWSSFGKHDFWHAMAPLQLFHNELCGPLLSASFFGFNYFLTFINNLSRRTCIYFLKSGVLRCF